MHLKVGLLDEEKILPLGKDITVVGMCGLSNGTPEIKSCKDLPVFMYRVHTFISCLLYHLNKVNAFYVSHLNILLQV